MADFDKWGNLMWRVARMRDLQKKADKLRGWEASDLLKLEQEVDKLVGDYFAEELMPNPDPLREGGQK